MRAIHTMLTTIFCAVALVACASDGTEPAAADSTDTPTTVEATTSTAAPETTAVETTDAETSESIETTTTAVVPETTADTVDPDESSADPTCGLSVRLAFDEGAPRDRMTISNDSTDSVSIAALEFDLTESAGQVIFDTLEGGTGVEVFQDFQVEGGDATLAETPVAEDGASNLRLDFTTFAQGQTFTFSIDVDDQLTDSDLGQIQVTGGELAGAETFVTTTDDATVVAVFGDNDTAEFTSAC